MNLRNYRIFVEVYEKMSMSHVAEQMFLSQPAVSRVISELEKHYCIRFFLRQNGRLIRTAGGMRFYQYAKELIACEERLNLAMLQQQYRRKATLGVSPSVAARFLPPLLRAYRDECGELDLSVVSTRLETLEQMIIDSRVELAVIEGQVASWEVKTLPLFSEEMVLVTAEDYTLPAGEPMPLLVRDVGEAERHRFVQVLRDAQVEYTIKGTLVDDAAIKYFARCGLGIGLLPRNCLQGGDGLQILDIPGATLSAQYSIAFHRKRYLFEELVRLIDFLFSHWNGTPASKLFPEQMFK